MTHQHLKDIPDWAKIKAHREAYPGSMWRDSEILKDWSRSFAEMKTLARRIARDDKPPVSQETLIWREVWARDVDDKFPHIAKEYREGLRDRYRNRETVLGTAIKLALEGFGKDGVTGNG